MVSDTYVREETPAGHDREFWIEATGSVRRTLEFQVDGDFIEVCLWSEVTEAAPEWESRTVIRVTLADSRRIIERLERIAQNGTHPPNPQVANGQSADPPRGLGGLVETLTG